MDNVMKTRMSVWNEDVVPVPTEIIPYSSARFGLSRAENPVPGLVPALPGFLHADRGEGLLPRRRPGRRLLKNE